MAAADTNAAPFAPDQLAELAKLQRRMRPAAAEAVLRDRIRRRAATATAVPGT